MPIYTNILIIRTKTEKRLCVDTFFIIRISFWVIVIQCIRCDTNYFNIIWVTVKDDKEFTEPITVVRKMGVKHINIFIQKLVNALTNGHNDSVTKIPLLMIEALK